jgi:uncharacterized repeat protein (TIGR03803 family)
MIAARCLRNQPRRLSARVATSEKDSVLHSFGVGSDGAVPSSGLVASEGHLYGTTYLGGTNMDPFGVTAGTVYEETLPVGKSGSTEKVIYNFTGGADGDHPEQLVAAGDALIGITASGGDRGGDCPISGSGCGTVFKLWREGSGWKESTIYTFINQADSSSPDGLVFAGGVVYVAADGFPPGDGAVIALTPPARGQTAWSESTIYNFTNNFSNSGLAYPYDIIAAGDSLYGFTASSSEPPCFCGAVFQLTPSRARTTPWTETTLHDFTGSEGEIGGSLIAAGGALYGTAELGGIGFSPSCPNYPYCGYGTVFALTPTSVPGSAWNEHTIYEFTNGADGSSPNGAIAAACGLIGTTTGGNGTVFELSVPRAASGSAWLERTLYTFGGTPDGMSPNAQLLPSSDGVLYGTTYAGGSTGNGTVFQLNGPDVQADWRGTCS